MLGSLIFALIASTPTAAQQTQAPEAPAGLVWMVVSEMNRAYDDIDDPTNRPALVTAPPEGVIRSFDIDRDGLADWMVRWPEDSRWCGTGGCRVTLYLSRDGGLRRVFDRQTVHDLRFSAEAGGGRIEGDFHPLLCVDSQDLCRLAWTIAAGETDLMPVAASPDGPEAAADDVGPIDDTWRERN